MKLRTAVWCAAALVLSACSGGDGGVIGTGFKISGAAQKGPFVIGSEVLLNQLQANGTPSTSTILTEISDDLGNFKFDVTQSGPVLMTADGYHFNEITGKLSQGRLLLKAIYNATSEPDQHAFINILTHLAYKRTLALMGRGLKVADAIAQAEGEIVNAFKQVLPVSGVTDFTALNIYNVDERLSNGNAYALALSAAIYQYAMLEQQKSLDSSVDAVLTNILNNLADDIATNGTVTSTTIIAKLVQATRLLRPDEIRKHLEDRSFDVRAQKLPVANIDLFIDTDGDGIVNAEDPDDDNDGIPDGFDASPYVYSEAPVLIKPDVTNALPSGQEIVFEWTSSEYAKSFEIQISKSVFFTTTVVSQITANKTLSATLDVGAYYFRARSLNAHDFWGEWSFPTQLGVSVFVRSYGDSGSESAQKIIQTSDSGFAIIGNTNNSRVQNHAVLLLRLDPFGKILWQTTFDTAEIDLGSNIVQTSDGGFLLAASTALNGKNALRLIKTDHTGTQEWSTTTEGLAAGGIQMLPESDGVLIGSAWVTNVPVGVGTTTQPRFAPHLLKIDQKGNSLWTYTFDENVLDFETLNYIGRNKSGDYVLIGNHVPTGKFYPYDQRPFFAQVSADRTSLIYFAFKTSDFWGPALGATVTPDSNVLLEISRGPYNPPQLYKFDLSGKQIWSYTPNDPFFTGYEHSPVIERNGINAYIGQSDDRTNVIQLFLLDADGYVFRMQQYNSFRSPYFYSDLIT
ncbi:MAG: hypothetical protein HY273_10485, partial [Gammaproteobacteria bacterium]|nr:hypothetical protein [Gammaproteobacteria bacterium]